MVNFSNLTKIPRLEDIESNATNTKIEYQIYIINDLLSYLLVIVDPK